MKKTTAILLAAAMLLSLCACGSGGSGGQFAAKINYTYSGGITVTPDVLSSEYRKADTFAVTIGDGTKILDSSGTAIDQRFLTADEEVIITYDGNIEDTYPAHITALSVKLRNGVVSSAPSAQPGDTVTFASSGGTDTEEADRVALKGCYILVPSSGWVSKSAEGTEVGPLIISPRDVSGTALTFRVHVGENTADVQALLSKQHPDFEWTAWEEIKGASDTAQASCVADGEYFAAYTAQTGADTVSILCRCRADVRNDWGAKLAAIAATLTVK